VRREARGGRRDGERIAIFRALQLGDLLCTVPAWRALRAAYPHAHVTLIGLPWARDFAQRYRYLDDFIAFPGAPGLPEQEPDPAAYARFLDTVRNRRFDLVVQMHGSGELTNPLVATWGARRIAGFHPGLPIASEERVLLHWLPHEPEVRRYLRLADALGAPPQGEELEFPIRDEERAELALLPEAPLARYVCVHPGARFPSRRWPVERFAAVADALADRGYRAVVTGSQAEAPLAHALRATMRHPALDYTGRTSLGALAALVAGARLVVSNDPGMAQDATAV
jgi:ADP-heptose:LPS heptosyltransferase